jgi:hypothetical protein
MHEAVGRVRQNSDDEASSSASGPVRPNLVTVHFSASDLSSIINHSYVTPTTSMDPITLVVRYALRPCA